MKSVLQYYTSLSGWSDWGTIRTKSEKGYDIIPIQVKDWLGQKIVTAYRLNIDGVCYKLDYLFSEDLNIPATARKNTYNFRIRNTDFTIISRKRTKVISEQYDLIAFYSAHGYLGGEMVMLRDAIDTVPKPLTAGGIYYVYVVDAITINLQAYSGGPIVQITDIAHDEIDILEIEDLRKIDLGVCNYNLECDQQQKRNGYPKYLINVQKILNNTQPYDLTKWVNA